MSIKGVVTTLGSTGDSAARGAAAADARVAAIEAQLAEAHKALIRKDAELAAQRVQVSVLGRRGGAVRGRSALARIRSMFRRLWARQARHAPANTGIYDGLDPRHVAWVKESPLFDADWYLRTYPDVAAAGIDPLRHFLESGASERRNPGPDFSSGDYLKANKDVARAGVNPLVHFIEFGRAEGRPIRPAGASTKKKSGAALPLFPDAGVAPPLRSADVLADDCLPAPITTIISAPPWRRFAELDRANGRPTLMIGMHEVAFLPPDGGACVEGLARLAVVGVTTDVRLADGTRVAAPQPGAAADAPATLTSVAGIAVTDLWLSDPGALTLRITSASDNPAIVRIAQTADGSLRVVGEALISKSDFTLVEAAGIDQLRPLLLFFTGLDGIWLGCSVLPFPSLCRGGYHYGELAAVAASADYLRDLVAYSGRLVDQQRGWMGAPPFSVARLVVDMRDGNGSELLLQPDVMAWLSAGLGMAVEAASGGASTLIPVGATVTAARAEGGTLTIGVDSIPTLAAMLSRTLIGPGAGSCCVVADRASGAPKWFVRMPPMDDLSDLQPAIAAAAWPCFRPAEDDDAHGLQPGAVPLAIAFRSAATPAAATLLRPTGLSDGPVLRAPPPIGAAAAVTVIIDLHAGCERLARSIATQRNADHVEVFVVSADHDHYDGVSATLFPGRFRFIFAPGLPRAARLNLAASFATAPAIAFVAESIVLHDPRTLETMATILARPTIASAACVVINERHFAGGNQLSFHSGGYFASAFSFDAPPGLVLAQPATLFPFPASSYPVLANAAPMLVVRRDIWASLGGFDAARFPHDRFDIDYAFRAGAKGHRHICTSAVTVTDLAEMLPAGQSDPVSPACFEIGDWQSMIGRAAVLRELRW